MKEKILGMVKSTAGAVLIVTILMTVIVQLLTGHFYTAYNLSTFSRSASFTIIIGFAQTLVLLLGGIDLSVASVAGLCSMIFAMLTTVGGVNPFLSIAIALMAGVALGAINGIFICSLNLTPFIVTLATSALYKGIIYVATKGIPLTGIPESVTIIGQGTLFGIIPYPAIIMVVLAVILIYMLRYTSFGRHIYAVGGNEHAAKIVGIQINKTKMAVYALTGFISALAGILMVLRLGSSQVNIGENWAMPSITAGVLGGTSMNGGSGGIGGTIVGGLLMSVISFSISLLGISSYWDQIVTGVVVLIAVAIDAIRRRNNSNV
ncbi:ABC transporter permease [Enterocloster sp. 210928-DFI.2.20]|jgi:ribose transport system permease protein|uniref:ABC transporter permease n=1 Tax=Enterocloster bolteae TaxID=208479 RepID=A0A412Z6A8_9FIRM|nr:MULTISPECIES: ABC transporter permease [Enterocloster]CCX97036.1 ribose/xylose/arabinose/galactoside ABC-type transport systems permease components [Enterocloster bolteae CAG:59]MCB7094805.1 ABC transporter permease [Enterocloster sp. 210928-DFI.2.20]MCB7234012.1 ABC transporter permease [Enterocloster bolteae]MCB7354199.1 ABC transporter permease [Enterocloster bolteae]MCG4946565.1 ABC transporter permease [Enterocloster bolteae]